MQKRLIFTLAALWLLLLATHAGEGMWLPWNIHPAQWEEMKKMGLKLSREEIYSPRQASLKDAVVMLDSGSCTGSFVSPQGLILTNHHCAYSDIQTHSCVSHDYLTNGFWAKSPAEELPNPGKTAMVLIKTEDVTALFESALIDTLKTSVRERMIDSISVLITDTASHNGRFTAQIDDFYYQEEFHLFVYETYRDVRLVGAPPENIAQFGGTRDNWRWPRHSADFALYRVYTGPNGSPAPYSPQNVPYVPRKHLQVNKNGVQNNDFTMILGYPGETQRFVTSFAIEEISEVINPVVAEVRALKQQIWKDGMHRSPQIGIQYADKYATSSNYQKYASGQIESILETGLIDRRKALETEFESWVSSDTIRQEQYHQVLSKAQLLYLLRRKLAQTGIITSETLINGPDINAFALEGFVLHNALEKEDEPRVELLTRELRKQGEVFFRDFDAGLDQKVFEAMIEYYRQHMDDSLRLPDQELFAPWSDLSTMADSLYAGSIFTNEQRFNQFLDNPSFNVLHTDPAFDFMMRVATHFAPVYSIMNRFDSQLELIMNNYLDGMRNMQSGRTFYPDANSTLRLTYGQVGPYSPRDGISYKAFTTSRGLLEKARSGIDDYVLPDSLLALYHQGDAAHPGVAGPRRESGEQMPLCFISSNDITGGNSGSAVLNAHGQLVGLAFDGNQEGMASDLEYVEELQKCVSVDIRHILYLMKELGNADHLLQEMEITDNPL